LLLAAAGLKINGLVIDPLSQDSFLASPRLLAATVEVEVLLGLWLLSGWWQPAARVAALGFFAILAGVSLYLALDGQASCGCLGRLPANPWLTFAIDLAAVAVLALGRPKSALDTRAPDWLSGLLKTGASAAALLALTGGVAFLALGNPADALARLRGEPLAIDPPVSAVGEGVRGEERAFTIRLHNHTQRPVCLVGGTASCRCFTTDDLPLTVPAGESRPLRVRMTFRGEVGRFQRPFLLHTDDEDQQTIVARFTGRVIEPPSP
jgi:hypothetical protein